MSFSALQVIHDRINFPYEKTTPGSLLTNDYLSRTDLRCSHIPQQSTIPSCGTLKLTSTLQRPQTHPPATCSLPKRYEQQTNVNLGSLQKINEMTTYLNTNQARREKINHESVALVPQSATELPSLTDILSLYKSPKEQIIKVQPQRFFFQPSVS
ncbi:hypothetical protein FDP41_011678 [Naegleria fowleri]|uniref:Uncharacterized protein n=1 Tax=Naegleria fowleri TaxID=5763 RepID=A0A6A5BVX4_NAEFO|nr:uncharacterized protein FDP41_011678 [Naegleria fowleri]KAF0982223.1 hypothetical protein FDP41_011678 [Naegleria fowleri]